MGASSFETGEYLLKVQRKVETFYLIISISVNHFEFSSRGIYNFFSSS